MNSFEILVVPILMCGFAMCATIISMDTYYNNPVIAIEDDDMSMGDLYSFDGVSNILETVYVSQSFGKSHRFYFTQGERKDGKPYCNFLRKFNAFRSS